MTFTRKLYDWLKLHVLVVASLGTIPNSELASRLIIEDGLKSEPVFEREIVAAWNRLENLWRQVNQNTSIRIPALRVRFSTTELGPKTRLKPGQSGAGIPGLVVVRQKHAGRLDEQELIALRHEIAHQFLWAACPAASQDALFHEAFALATSGEMTYWADGPYLSLSQAKQQLETSPSLDRQSARRALARLLAETSAEYGLAKPQSNHPLTRRLKICAGNSRWPGKMTPGEIASLQTPSGNALVLLSRHSGEILFAEGDYDWPMPFGSTLKPFFVAGAGDLKKAPQLKIDSNRVEWKCTLAPISTMNIQTALLRSCNGYFLDWASKKHSLFSFGPWQGVLLAAGLSSSPQNAAQAIGLQSNLTISPLGLAEAYRILAQARPEVIEILQKNISSGTLAGIPKAKTLQGLAIKTGTVRNAESQPVIGWMVAVDTDWVLVMAQKNRQPRDFVVEFSRTIIRARNQSGARAAKVQVFALAEGSIYARCPGNGVLIKSDTPVLIKKEKHLLNSLLKEGPIICMGSPWKIKLSHEKKEREYAGIFSKSPFLTKMRKKYADGAQGKALLARRGSETIFRTTMRRYAAGVLAAEDSQIVGEPRAALLRIVAQNHDHSRHWPRPVCDTTHCQVFHGTASPRAGDANALEIPISHKKGWIPFSKGGNQPWIKTRSRASVEKILNLGKRGQLVSLAFYQGKVIFRWTEFSRMEPYEEEAHCSCEFFRSALKLPSCPSTGSIGKQDIDFRGTGAGHGMGLDVERAKKSKMSSQELIKAAAGNSGN